MKITLDITERLYMAAKIRAVERGETLNQVILNALEKTLRETAPPALTRPPTFRERRRLLPEFERMLNADRLSAGTEPTALISEDRTARSDALL
jgi:hypothetical protein